MHNGPSMKMNWLEKLALSMHMPNLAWSIRHVRLALR